jgi:hypothetical protein
MRQIEQVYLINERNFEMALNSLLCGELPPEDPEEIKFVVQEEPN